MTGRLQAAIGAGGIGMLLTVLGAGVQIGANMQRIQELEKRVTRLETPGGSTVPATETVNRLDALERRIDRLEDRPR